MIFPTQAEVHSRYTCLVCVQGSVCTVACQGEGKK